MGGLRQDSADQGYSVASRANGSIRGPMLDKPLIQKHRRGARLLLYLLPVLLFAGAWGFIRIAGRLTSDMDWGKVDYSDNEAVGLLQEFLRIDTSYPTGNEILGAEFLARELEAAGIATHIERLGERNANLWAIIEGDDPKALVLHNHLDTEPVRNPARWRHPPFGGVIAPPFIYGRGAFDMKSYTISQLVAMLEVKRSGIRPQRSLIFLATAEEEIDSRLGTVRLLREHPDLVARFDVILTEGGAVEAITLDRAKYWGTEFGQKRFVDVWICDADEQRLKDLRADLLEVELELKPPSEQVLRFFERYSPSRENPMVQWLLQRTQDLRSNPDFESLPRYLKAMMRNEVVPFPVTRDPGGGYLMRVILHLLPDANLEDAWSELMPAWIDGFTYTVDEPHGPSPPSPLDHEVFAAIDDYMAEAMPQVQHGPLFVPWSATDARFFRLAGVPSYGFAPFWILSSETNKMKGVNERMAVAPFVAGVELYSGLVQRLVSSQAE